MCSYHVLKREAAGLGRKGGVRLLAESGREGRKAEGRSGSERTVDAMYSSKRISDSSRSPGKPGKPIPQNRPDMDVLGGIQNTGW